MIFNKNYIGRYICKNPFTDSERIKILKGSMGCEYVCKKEKENKVFRLKHKFVEENFWVLFDGVSLTNEKYNYWSKYLSLNEWVSCVFSIYKEYKTIMEYQLLPPEKILNDKFMINYDIFAKNEDGKNEDMLIDYIFNWGFKDFESKLKKMFSENIKNVENRGNYINYYKIILNSNYGRNHD